MTAIIGIKVENRREEASKLQDILTEYGCVIKTRIGLHDMDKINEIYDRLAQEWQVQIMRF